MPIKRSLYNTMHDVAEREVAHLPDSALRTPLPVREIERITTAMREAVSGRSPEDGRLPDAIRLLAKALRAARVERLHMDEDEARDVDYRAAPGESPMFKRGIAGKGDILPYQFSREELAFVETVREEYGSKTAVLRAGLALLMRQHGFEPPKALRAKKHSRSAAQTEDTKATPKKRSTVKRVVKPRKG